MNFELRIAWLYPDLMSTYGDRGNIICLKKRCQWRGIKVNINEISLETPSKELNNCNLIFMGGAQDRQQKIISRDFLNLKAPVVKKLISKNIPGLFVCAAYQFMGHFYQPYRGVKIKGAGIFDLYTEHPGDQAKRLIGNVVAEILPCHSRENGNLAINQKKDPRVQVCLPAGRPEDDSLSTIVGFENHGGRTYLGKNIQPLAKVIKGFGNNGEDGFEGAIYKNAIGSYLHGPVLPKNPHLADWLIKKAVEVKYGKKVELAGLDDTLEWQAHEFAVNLK